MCAGPPWAHHPSRGAAPGACRPSPHPAARDLPRAGHRPVPLADPCRQSARSGRHDGRCPGRRAGGRCGGGVGALWGRRHWPCHQVLFVCAVIAGSWRIARRKRSGRACRVTAHFGRCGSWRKWRAAAMFFTRRAAPQPPSHCRGRAAGRFLIRRIPSSGRAVRWLPQSTRSAMPGRRRRGQSHHCRHSPVRRALGCRAGAPGTPGIEVLCATAGDP